MEDKIYLIRKHGYFDEDYLGFCETRKEAEDNCARLTAANTESGDTCWFDFQEIEKFEF